MSTAASSPGQKHTTTATTDMTSHPPGPLHINSAIMTSADSQIPIRHPRPLTAAELHLELEKEQEAVVNRLTRELSALRAQHSASVASNASHSSAGSHQAPSSILPPDSDPTMLGHNHPTLSRQRRSSSTASSRSLGLGTSNTGASAILNARGVETVAPLGGVSQASAARAAAAGGNLSRNPSLRSTSGTSTPARPSFDYPAYHGMGLPHRPSLSNAPSFMSNHSTAGSVGGTSTSATTPSTGHGPVSPLVNPTPYYTDAAAAKAELELVKDENEALRQRVRALEQALKSRRRESQQSLHSEAGATRERSLSRPSTQQPNHVTPVPGAGGVNIVSWAAGTTVAGPRDRSESQSTTASTRRALATDDRDDTIRVGESAASGAANPRLAANDS